MEALRAENSIAEICHKHSIMRKKYKLKDMNWLLPQMEIYAVK